MRKITQLLVLLLMLSSTLAFAQNKEITGVVTGSEDGVPIPGVTVYVKNTNVGTTTNIDGEYSLSLRPEHKIAVYSYVGLQTKEVSIGDQTVINIALDPDALNIDEIVVTAIGIPKEAKALGYSVQQVDGDVLAETANTNLIDGLAGRVADVQVISSAGTAGAGSYITIRGSSTITGNAQPLFVVDGVPIDNGGGLGTVDGVALSNRAIDLNPDDIESVNVLKGGSATALYGIRAANGAIIITTKKGVATKGKKINVNYRSSVSFTTISQVPDLTQKFGQGYDGNWVPGISVNWGPKLDTCFYDPAQKDDYNVYGGIVGPDSPNSGERARGFDHYDFFQTGIAYNNSINLSGGNEVSTFYLSASDLRSEGVVMNNTFNRSTFKISGQTKLSDKFSISGDANYIVSDGDRIQQGSNASGVMLGLLRSSASFDNSAGYELADGSQRNYLYGGGYDNPYWTANKNLYRDKVNRFIGKGELQYLPTDWLSIIYRFGVDNYSTGIKDYFARNSAAQPQGFVSVENFVSRDVNSDLLLNVTKNINEDLVFNGVGGWHMSDLFFNSTAGEAASIIIPNYYNLNNSGSVIATESTSHIRRAAFFADLGLSYKNTYYFNVTGRNDWSTTLPVENNSFFYPSFNTSIILSEIPGINESISHIIPFAKIRASYAIIANDAPAYRTRNNFITPLVGDGWTNGLNFPFLGRAGYTLSTILGNNKIKPELTKSWEVGLDLKFFDNRIGIDATYFNNQVSEAIITVDVPASSGFGAYTLNAAELEAKGWEISLYAEPFRSKNFGWDMIANITVLENNVKQLAPGLETLFLGGFTSTQIIAREGSYGSIYGSYFLRDDQGNLLIDPDSSFPIVGNDKKSIGDVLPDWTLGITNNFRYKNLSLSFLWDFKFGGKMWNGTRGALAYFGTLADQDDRGKMEVINGVVAEQQADGTWVSTGTQNDTEVAIDEYYYTVGPGSGWTGADEAFVEDANWARLRDVTLNYSFGEKVIGKNGFIKGLEVYFTGTNLLLFTPYKGVDPETSLYGASNAQGIDYFNMPGSKSYTFGLKLKL